MKKIILSTLIKTWMIDLDGVIFKHNSHLSGENYLLENVKEFFDKIPEKDYVLLLTARSLAHKKITEAALKKNKIRFDKIIYDLPVGERIIINDAKISGLKTAFAINTVRDRFPKIKIIYDKAL